MRQETPAPDGSVVLPRRGQGALPLASTWVRDRVPAAASLGPWAGHLALVALLAGTVVLVAFATSGNSILVPRSGVEFPGWEAGPLAGLFGHPWMSRFGMTFDYSALVGAMTVAYLAAVAAARSLSMRTIAAAVVALNLVLLMSPPLQLNDVFNYIGYARLGSLHGLNPYTHVIQNEAFDPVFRLTSWWNLSSPYGPLFTALSYPLAWLPLPAAYWVLKLVTIALSLGFLWCVARTARLLGRDPRPAVLFVAANPIYLFYELGGFHNDLFMLLPSTAAVALLLARRDHAAGAALVVAVAVKFTVVVLLPFLLIAARPPDRRLRVLTGALAAAIPLALMSVALFGLSLPNLGVQSGLITGLSLPNLLGLAAGTGGATHAVMRVVNVGVVLVVLAGLRRRDWVAAAGWAQLALVASMAWLMPWYIVWVLPLAAVAGSARLRRGAVAFTVFLVVTFAPATNWFLHTHDVRPMNTPVGNAALAYQRHYQR
jgi:hypothetical protein